jgi:uncharacterized phage protein gp47/JayE
MAITSAGYLADTTSSIYNELATAAIAASGDPDLDVSTDSDLGVLLGVLADGLAARDAATAEVYAASYPDGAVEVQLENVCALTGIYRLAATYAEVDVTMVGTSGMTVPAGTLFDSGSGTPQVALLADTVLTGGTATGRCRCTTTGPNPFLATTVNHIATPVSGLTSVSNDLEGVVLGTDIETYEALRSRRTGSLRAMGGASTDAMRAAVLDVDGVVEAYVIENNEDVTVDSLPPHSFEVVMNDNLAAMDANEAVGAEILRTKPSGIYSYGTVSQIAYDATGTPRTVRFSRPSEVNIYVSVTVETWGSIPTDLSTLIVNAILAEEVKFKIGNNVFASKFVAPIAAVWTGIEQVTVTVGTAPAPTGVKVVLSNRQIAAFDSTRIAVTVTPLSEV